MQSINHSYNAAVIDMVNNSGNLDGTCTISNTFVFPFFRAVTDYYASLTYAMMRAATAIIGLSDVKTVVIPTISSRYSSQLASGIADVCSTASAFRMTTQSDVWTLNTTSSESPFTVSGNLYFYVATKLDAASGSISDQTNCTLTITDNTLECASYVDTVIAGGFNTDLITDDLTITGDECIILLETSSSYGNGVLAAFVDARLPGNNIIWRHTASASSDALWDGDYSFISYRKFATAMSSSSYSLIFKPVWDGESTTGSVYTTSWTDADLQNLVDLHDIPTVTTTDSGTVRQLSATYATSTSESNVTSYTYSSYTFNGNAITYDAPEELTDEEELELMGQYATQIAEQEATIASNATTISNQETTISNYTTQITELTSQVNTLTASKTSLTSEVSTLQEDVDELTEQVSELTVEVTTLTSQKSTLTSQVATLTTQKSELETQIAEYEEQVEQQEYLTDEIADLTAQVTTLQTNITTLTTQRDTLQANVTTYTQQVSDLTVQIGTLTAKEAALSASIITKTAELQTLQAEIDTTDVASLQSQLRHTVAQLNAACTARDMINPETYTAARSCAAKSWCPWATMTVLNGQTFVPDTIDTSNLY